ncbi:hypothetical protein BDN70DRAFT_886179 [Pholiota conissans]|uniref:Uncharacterized protein n=1 Tax=Pholiota conissans TaxID=109636 RepID=A0A9P6CV08_9AGAR|nr:hypothetical protein BDN70DRAFT_886179 [Pholiota conissans]
MSVAIARDISHVARYPRCAYLGYGWASIVYAVIGRLVETASLWANGLWWAIYGILDYVWRGLSGYTGRGERRAW